MIVEVTVAAIVVFMGIVALWKARPALDKFVRITNALDNLPAFMDRADKDIKHLKAAVMPNHGTAIPDGIGRLERDVTTILGRLDSLEQWVQAESDEADETHAEMTARIELLGGSTIQVTQPPAAS